VCVCVCVRVFVYLTIYEGGSVLVCDFLPDNTYVCVFESRPGQCFPMLLKT
jgi:hypothetical protein